ncbi:GTP cyclohydrolase 1 type 2 homolog YbgI [hydrothermal vent metagenome]|uniref:GTP cyclohydrolase 1 type 2 homolog YbgI n=1 Tax=hydrothermal vent metagenome TaxID=652676 RepID=A0A3B1BYV7_9ZZZZ
MADLYEIVSYANELLETDRIKDYCPNGLQVEGKKDVRRIVTGVSACMELFEEAARRNANAILVHHGMFWDSDPKPVRGSLKARIKYLLENDLSLIGYHLPLDRHPEVGNNIELVKKLGLIDPEPFGMYGAQSISYIARTKEPTPVGAFIKTVSQVTGRKPRSHLFGPELINMVSICSGGAPGLLREAIDRQADMFVTGEEAEWIYHLSKEERIHYVAAGHHATERLGVMALGKRIEEKFGIEVLFVEVANPI